jgi:hypothetical protein
MPRLTGSHRGRAVAAGLATIALVLGATVAIGTPASADTPPPGQGTLFADLGQTQFPGEGQGWCSYGVPEFEGEYEEQGWVQIPAGVNHVLVTAVGDAGSSGSSGGASGGLGGVVSAIVPALTGQIFYASPDSSVTQDTSAEANGGRASFISKVSPTTFFPTNDPAVGLPNPNNLCFTEFDPEDYPSVMPASDLVLVAGGGGGGGDLGTAGLGGNAGPNGVNGTAAGGAGGGGGGTQSGGGAGGAGADFNGYNGTYLSGGDNFNPNVVIGGGGGAGYWGGGSGSGNGDTASGGGGGGSNYIVGLPSDGVSKVISDGSTTAPSEASIVPIYEPTVRVSAPVNPSVENIPTTITVTISGLPTVATEDDEGNTVTVRPAASGTVSMVVNGVRVTQSFDPLVGANTGVRTATFTVTGESSGATSYVATYNGDSSQQSLFYFADIVAPETSAPFFETYKAPVTATVSGSMTYGDSTATFTHSQSLPGGVTISGTAACTTADGGKGLSTLSAGSHVVDPASCSGLTLGGANAANYAIAYGGSVTVAPKPIIATVTGTQPAGGAPTFAVDASTPSGLTVTGSPTCAGLEDGTAIGPSLPQGIYTLGTCTGLTLAGTNASDYTLTVTGGQFVSGTETPTLTMPTPDGAVVGSAIQATATLAGGGSPGGGVTLSLYDGASCAGSAIFAGSTSVAGNGDYESGAAAPPHAGDYSWQATYSGDTFNAPATSDCMPVTIAKATAGVTFTTPAAGLVGQSLSASVTLSSSVPRVGSSDLRIILYPASDTTCTGNTALILSEYTVLPDGVYTSASYTPTDPGTYRWVILYGGDEDHESDFSICSLTTVVGSAPTITSGARATFNAGGSGSFAVTTIAGSPAGTTLTAAGTLPAGVSFVDHGDGTGTLSGTPGATTGGQYPIGITAANSVASTTQSFVLTVQQPAVITTPNATTFLAGSASTFTIRANPGYPTATTLSTSSALPAGITFTDNGDGTATFVGTPGLTTGGTYPISIHASNSVVFTTQSFVLTVNQTPVITTADATTFVTGGASSFTIRASAGYPGPVVFHDSGTLPDGVTLTDNADGTATLAGTPGAMTRGSYPIDITASNSKTSVSQNFVLTVEQAPTIATVNSTAFVTGIASSFTIGTNAGYPAATALSVSGTLPGGVGFTDNQDGTATLSGIPNVTSGGSYPLTFTASNGVLPDATQSFTLSVDQPVAIGGSGQAVFEVGQNGSHPVTTTAGYPTASTLTLDGGLPAGLSFTDSGDGTGYVSGTPRVGSGGDYPVTIAASNGVGTPALQNLDLTVNESPAITSPNNWTSTIGVTSSFTVTTAPGYPTAYSLTDSGALPPGLSLTLSGDSATVSGVPTGLPGDYPITLTASNGVAPDTVQTLTLTVAGASAVPLPLLPPVGGGVITGVPAATHPGQSFTATASGFAAGAPITWGIYSSPQNLASTIADSAGMASAQITIPAGFAGVHTIVVTGIAPDGSSFVASATTTVTARATPAQLPTTGASLGTSPAAAALLLGIGILFVLVARLRRRRRRA